MKLISGVIFFITALALTNATSEVTLKRIATDQLLLRNLMESRSSDYVEECFGLYIPIFNAILQQFSDSFQLCATKAQASLDELSNEAAGNRTLITSSAQNICTSMTDCSALDNTLDFFDCYASVGNSNVKKTYNLTATASILAAELREQYQVVVAERFKCQNASERVFTENYAATNEALTSCLLSGPPEIVTPTTTVAPEKTTAVAVEATTVVEETTTETSSAAKSEPQFEVEDLSRSVQTVAKVNLKSISTGKSGSGVIS